MGVTHRLATHKRGSVIMKFFALLPCLLASTAAYSIPYAGYSGYAGYAGYAGGYHPAHPVAYAAHHIAAPALVAAPAPVVAAPPAPAVAPVAVAKAAPVQAVAVEAAPVAAVAPQTTSSQFRAEDEDGNIAYGYQNINNAAEQRGNALGVVEGSYSFRDEAGLHTVSYVADDLGFRLPGRSKRSVAPVAYAGVPAVGYAGVPAVVQSAPAVRDAVLTTIKLNPGHAIFYRVD